MGNVNWDEVTSGGYVVIEEGTPTTLVLKNWKPQTTFKDNSGNPKIGVEFDCYQQDNKTFDDKTKIIYTVCAKGALKQFAPICKKAEAMGKDSIKVTVIGVGKGKERTYSIKELE